jgi:uncharacterized membrane protein YheB (UPF0754 family)
MTSGQLLIILFAFTLTGWFIAWMIIKILFWPVKPVKFGMFRLQGLLPARQHYFAGKIGALVQSAFHEYKGLDEKISDPALLQKLKPEIEDHVDHFLKEKLKTVFPLLSQFMGEKTISQFKTAFLIEIDNLFPVLMKNYVSDLKEQVRLDTIISEKINALSILHLRELFYLHAGREIRNFRIACSCIGLLAGIITSLILLMVNI